MYSDIKYTQHEIETLIIRENRPQVYGYKYEKLTFYLKKKNHNHYKSMTDGT